MYCGLCCVQFSLVHSVMSSSLQPHGLQHARLPCLSPTPRACWNSCPLSWWCHPTISSSVVPFSCSLQSFPASSLVFSNESVLRIKWPKYWSFSFSISPSNEYSGLISFRIDWLDLLAVQRTLKSLLQHHSSKVLILRCSAFFIIQLSHPFPLSLPKIMNSRVWTLKISSTIFFNFPNASNQNHIILKNPHLVIIQLCLNSCNKEKFTTSLSNSFHWQGTHIIWKIFP